MHLFCIVHYIFTLYKRQAPKLYFYKVRLIRHLRCNNANARIYAYFLGGGTFYSRFFFLLSKLLYSGRGRLLASNLTNVRVPSPGRGK